MLALLINHYLEIIDHLATVTLVSLILVFHQCGRIKNIIACYSILITIQKH